MSPNSAILKEKFYFNFKQTHKDFYTQKNMIRMRTVLQSNNKTFILQDTQMYSAKALSPLEVFH